MSRTSREKGKRGERKWRDALRDAGFSAERTGWMQSRGGNADLPDVQSEDLNIHFEVKTVEALRLNAALEQAQQDADGKPVAVVWQPSRREAVICMPASDWFQCVRGDLVNDDQEKGPTPSGRPHENNEHKETQTT